MPTDCRFPDRDAVEQRMIEAFRILPGRPCMSMGTRLVPGHAPAEAVEAFGWVERYVPDSDERKAMLTWARCRATGESWSERCKLLCWPKRTAEDRRERAAERIVTGLSRAAAIHAENFG